MERNDTRNHRFSRRSVIAVGIGATASLFTEKAVSLAPSPDTYGGGVLCVTGPNEEGVEELAAIHENAVDNELYIDQSEIADRYGLTVINSEVVQKFINEHLLTARTSLDAAELLSAFTLEHFGIPVYIDTKTTVNGTSRSVGYPIIPVDSQAHLLRNLSKLPLEFYESIGISHIMMEDLEGNVGGDYTHQLDRVRLDSSYVWSAEVLYHEFSHALHLDGCGSFEDMAITNTLPEGVEYTNDSRNVQLPGNVFADPYGQKNYIEDFATIAAAWITGYIGLSDEIDGTPVYDKLAVVMDRFETAVPNFVRYIEEVVRPSFSR